MQPTGQIIFLGRMDRQVKIRGFRVEPDEIEKTIILNEQVKDAALVLTQKKGKEIRMTAFMVPRPGTRPEEKQIRQWMQ